MMGRSMRKPPGEYKEQITVTLKADLINKLPKGRGKASKLITELLEAYLKKGEELNAKTA